MRFLLLFCLIISSHLLSAQENQQLYDIVETMTGERFEGRIVHYEYGKLLTIAVRDGSEITLSSAEVRRVRYARERSNTDSSAAAGLVNEPEDTEVFIDDWRNDLNFKKIERRLRPTLSMVIHGGKSEDNLQGFFFQETRTFGYSLEGVLHYRVLDWLDLGAGAVFDRFDTDRGESTLGYVGSLQVLSTGQKNFSPFLRLAIGYASPLKTEKNPLTEKDGGVLVHPGIGLRIGRTDQTFYTLDIGYRVLSTSYAVATFQGDERRTNSYRRLSLRLGATF